MYAWRRMLSLRIVLRPKGPFGVLSVIKQIAVTTWPPLVVNMKKRKTWLKSLTRISGRSGQNSPALNNKGSFISGS